MAMESKIDFMRTVEQSLASSITVTDMATVMRVINDVMEGYEMRKVDTWEEEKDDLLQCYVSALSVQNRSQKTIDRYIYVINKLMEYVKVPVRRITVYHVRNFLAKEKDRGICDNTLEGYREIFSAYFNWLQRESLIERNPMTNIGAITCAKKKKEVYSDVDLERLKRCCKNKRDLAIILFLYATCCRIGEVVSLNREQVMLSEQKCIVHGKGDKDRVVYFDSVTAEAIKDYLSERKDFCEALFIGKGIKRLHAGGIRAMLKRVAKEAGVNHVHPHKFRRSKATYLAKHGMPIQDIQHILGHEKIDTTMKYVQMDDGAVEISYRRFA